MGYSTNGDYQIGAYHKRGLSNWRLPQTGIIKYCLSIIRKCPKKNIKIIKLGLAQTGNIRWGLAQTGIIKLASTTNGDYQILYDIHSRYAHRRHHWWTIYITLHIPPIYHVLWHWAIYVQWIQSNTIENNTTHLDMIKYSWIWWNTVQYD